MITSLEREWYTIKETSELLGVKSTIIYNKITNKKSSLIAIKETEYKKEKGKYLIFRDYIYRCMEMSLKKEWYSVSEASKQLGKSETWFRNRIKNGKIPKSAYKKMGNKLLLHSSLLVEQQDHLRNIKENYYSYEESSLILGKSVYSISGFVMRGVFKNVVQSTSGGFILKEEIINYKEIIKDTISTSFIRTELNLSENQVTKFIKNETQIIANNITGNKYYIKNDSYQEFKKTLVYSIEMTSAFLNTKYEIAKMLIEKNYVKSFNVKNIGWRTSKSFLEEYLNRDEMPIEQLAMEINISFDNLYRLIRTGNLKAIKKNRRYFISIVEAERFKQSLTVVYMKYYNTDKYQELFNESLTYFKQNSSWNKTICLYETWARKVINKSKWKKPKDKVTDLLNAFDSLLSKMSKEIFFYTDIELKGILSTLLNTHIRVLYPFLKYCKVKAKCSYEGDYVWKEKREEDTEIYTKEEWRLLTQEVLNIEKHFEKAIYNKQYAAVWLFSLLHFCLAWRPSDLKELKPVNLNIVGIENIEWFDKNTFSLEIAQTILKAVHRTMNGYLASKNNQPTVFVIPFIFELPTALAFTICELHRKQTNENSHKLITSSLQQTVINMFFEKGLPKFSSKKSNKTLMTYGWETAVKKGKGALAYWLGGFSRSHTHKIDMSNPVTQIYLVTSNTDASVDEMALHCFERGIFGWQIKIMIDALNNNKPLSLTEMTKSIEQINKSYSPMMIDSLSKYAVTRHEQSVLLLKELMAVPKNELKKRIIEISKLKSPSLLDHSQCLVGSENCPYRKEVEYNLEIPCLGCINRIDTNYILDIVNVELFSLFERLKNTCLSEENSRIKYTHMIRTLTYILLDFKRVFDKYDQNYIRSFIDLDKLHSCFLDLESSKFLRIEEVHTV